MFITGNRCGRPSNCFTFATSTAINLKETAYRSISYDCSSLSIDKATVLSVLTVTFNSLNAGTVSGLYNTIDT